MFKPSTGIFTKFIETIKKNINDKQQINESEATNNWVRYPTIEVVNTQNESRKYKLWSQNEPQTEDEVTSKKITNYQDLQETLKEIGVCNDKNVDLIARATFFDAMLESFDSHVSKHQDNNCSISHNTKVNSLRFIVSDKSVKIEQEVHINNPKVNIETSNKNIQTVELTLQNVLKIKTSVSVKRKTFSNQLKFSDYKVNIFLGDQEITQNKKNKTSSDKIELQTIDGETSKFKLENGHLLLSNEIDKVKKDLNRQIKQQLEATNEKQADTSLAPTNNNSTSTTEWPLGKQFDSKFTTQTPEKSQSLPDLSNTTSQETPTEQNSASMTKLDNTSDERTVKNLSSLSINDAKDGGVTEHSKPTKTADVGTPAPTSKPKTEDPTPAKSTATHDGSVSGDDETEKITGADEPAPTSKPKTEDPTSETSTKNHDGSVPVASSTEEETENTPPASPKTGSTKQAVTTKSSIGKKAIGYMNKAAGITTMTLFIVTLLEQFNVIKNNHISPGKYFNNTLAIAECVMFGVCIVLFIGIAIRLNSSELETQNSQDPNKDDFRAEEVNNLQVSNKSMQ